MKAASIRNAALVSALISGVLVFLTPVGRAAAFTSTTFASFTYYGYNFPTATQLSAGIFPIIIPMILAGLFSIFYVAFRNKGDFVVTLVLLGLSIGCLWDMLSTGAPLLSATGTIPLAVSVSMWLITGLWIYQGASGGQPAAPSE